MLRATLQESVPLQVLAADGRTDLFARALIYSGPTLLTTLALPAISNGIYGDIYIPNQEGYFTVLYQLFEDAGYTVPAFYDLEAEILEVSTEKTNILRILGILHENAVLDQQTYDVSGNLLSARLRAYDSKANAQLAGLAGLRYTWTVAAVYTGPGQLIRYSIERDL